MFPAAPVPRIFGNASAPWIFPLLNRTSVRCPAAWIVSFCRLRRCSAYSTGPAADLPVPVTARRTAGGADAVNPGRFQTRKKRTEFARRGRGAAVFNPAGGPEAPETVLALQFRTVPGVHGSPVSRPYQFATAEGPCCLASPMPRPLHRALPMHCRHAARAPALPLPIQNLPPPAS
jgi:hypothetical protein